MPEWPAKVQPRDQNWNQNPLCHKQHQLKFIFEKNHKKHSDCMMFTLRWFVISNAQQKWNDTIKEFRCNYELLPPYSTSLKEKKVALLLTLRFLVFLPGSNTENYSWTVETIQQLTWTKQSNPVAQFPSRINYLPTKKNLEPPVSGRSRGLVTPGFEPVAPRSCSPAPSPQTTNQPVSECSSGNKSFLCQY